MAGPWEIDGDIIEDGSGNVEFDGPSFLQDQLPVFNKLHWNLPAMTERISDSASFTLSSIRLKAAWMASSFLSIDVIPVSMRASRSMTIDVKSGSLMTGFPW